MRRSFWNMLGWSAAAIVFGAANGWVTGLLFGRAAAFAMGFLTGIVVTRLGIERWNLRCARVRQLRAESLARDLEAAYRYPQPLIYPAPATEIHIVDNSPPTLGTCYVCGEPTQCPTEITCPKHPPF